MLVSERMSHPVITIHPDTPLFDALGLMRTERIRRLPVVDKRGRLVDIHRIPDEVLILGAFAQNKLVGFLVYYPLLNWILNLAVQKPYRR